MGPPIAFEMLKEYPRSRARLGVSAQAATWPGSGISFGRAAHPSGKTPARRQPGTRPARDANSPELCPDSGFFLRCLENASAVRPLPCLDPPALLRCGVRATTTRRPSPVSHGQVRFCARGSSREVNASHLSSFSWRSGASAAFRELLFWVTHLPFAFLVAVREVQCPTLHLKPLSGPMTQLRARISSRRAGLTLAGPRRRAATSSQKRCSKELTSASVPGEGHHNLATSGSLAALPSPRLLQTSPNVNHRRKPQHSPHKGRSRCLLQNTTRGAQIPFYQRSRQCRFTACSDRSDRTPS